MIGSTDCKSIKVCFKNSRSILDDSANNSLNTIDIIQEISSVDLFRMHYTAYNAKAINELDILQWVVKYRVDPALRS